MAGVISLRQEADPPDPGTGHPGSGFPLDPSQFPPLLQSPGASSKAPYMSPPSPSFPWVFNKTKDSSPLPMDSLGSPSVNLDSQSTAMVISPPTTVPPHSPAAGLKKLHEVPSSKEKEMARISTQYTTLSAKAKEIPPLTTAPNSDDTVANPKSTGPSRGKQADNSFKYTDGPQLPNHEAGLSTRSRSISSGPSDKNAKAASNSNSYAGRAKVGTDRSLKRLAPLAFSPEGIPQITIPDEVFNRGAEAHKDFVLGVFTGRTPSYSQIQSVLTHIWGKGIKLEIHLRPSSRSMLVKIPNEFIRRKVVEQEIWHIGSSMFFVAQWSAQVAINPPSTESIPLGRMSLEFLLISTLKRV